MLDIQKLNKAKEEKETKLFDEQRKSNQLAEKLQDISQKLKKAESDLKEGFEIRPFRQYFQPLFP